ncbi:RmlC-like cupin [Apiospora rasikravindrae]|uniref:RmlC-like cupin n=1 Tax=Apiospora rasikravindrae TaxID=990691 RepID=A0ABR1TEQ7_9PEZI
MSSQPQPTQPVRLARAADLETSGGQTAGMLRQNAISGLCDGICALRPSPTARLRCTTTGAKTRLSLRSRATAPSSTKGGHKRVDLQPGDFCLIPAWAEHQEVNDGDEDAVWGIFRSGRTPEVVHLTGWGGSVAT